MTGAPSAPAWLLRADRSGLASAAHTFLRGFVNYAGRRGIVAAIFVVAGAFLESLGLFLLVPLLGVVFGTGSGPLRNLSSALFHAAGIESAVGRLTLLLVVFGCLMIARAVVISNRSVMLAELEIGFIVTEQKRVTGLLAAARWDRVVGLRHARVTHVISGDIERMGVAAHFLLQSATAGVLLISQCALAFLLSPVIAAIAIVLLAAGAAGMLPMMRRARALGDHLTDAHLALLNTTAQFLGGLKLAMSQDLQSRFVTEFGETLEMLTRRQIDYIRQQTHGSLALSTLSALIAGALVLAGFTIFHTEPAVLTTLLIVIMRMTGPAAQIQQGAQQLAYSLPAYEKVKVLEEELSAPARRIVPAAAGVSLPDGPIVFENVSFAYRVQEGEGSAERGVSGVSLTIQPGEFLGIAGPSGAGKTTFADLLAGLFSPQSGTIAIGGIALNDDLLPRLRAALSYVSQDPFLFHDTVRRNLTWAKSPVSDPEIWDALRLVGADAVVRGMENGLDTIVGERGTLVSGGERQRIALARAILRRPKLLVLDEATSAIDVAGERAIVENLLTLKPRPAIVMIAHRAESLARCDRVVRFENGRIVSRPDNGD